MKQARCKRAWQAEAIEDGRLSGEERASFERHAHTCRACTDERRQLAGLRQLAERLPVLGASPLERRRLRQSLLGHANAAAQNARGSAAWRPWAIAAAAVSAAAALAVIVHSASPSTHHRGTALSVPSFEIRASTGGAWRTAQRGRTLRIKLEHGVFSLHVKKLVAGQRFIASLPDGELEVRGTRFTVNVNATRTLRVSVSEGHVALRIRGRAERLLGPGETWTPAPAPHAPTAALTATRGAVTAPAQDRAPNPTDRSARAKGSRAQVSGETSASSPSRGAPSARRARGSQSPTPAASGPLPDPAAATLEAAMNAYHDGDFAQAQKLFTSFERKHPSDSRAEDAAFLRAVACLRRGDRANARALARDYLKRYPNGLRREEARRLLTDGGS